MEGERETAQVCPASICSSGRWEPAKKASVTYRIWTCQRWSWLHQGVFQAERFVAVGEIRALGSAPPPAPGHHSSLSYE